MFIGTGSSVVCLEALILFRKLCGLLIFVASSLACSSAVALCFFCLVRALYSLFTLQKLFSARVQSGCFCICLAKSLTSFFLFLHYASNQEFLGKGFDLCVLGFGFTFEHEQTVVWSRSVKWDIFSLVLSVSSWNMRLESLCLNVSVRKESSNSVISSEDQ